MWLDVCLACGADVNPVDHGGYPENGKLLRRDAAVEEVYELGKLLGKGAYSVVKLATELDNEDQWACKIMRLSHRSQQADEPGTNRVAIMQEIDVMLDLDHPNIVRLKEYYVERGRVYLIMELMQGGELLDALREKGYYSEGDARTIFRQLVEAVQYLHSKNIVHRDIKLKNLLLAEAGDISQVKLSDFGLAYKGRQGGLAALSTVCGTPGYIAPEVLQLQQQLERNGSSYNPSSCYGPACDLWAAGVVLFALLSGVLPFQEKNESRLQQAVMAGRYSFGNPAWSEVSDEGKNLVRKLLVVDPAQRFTCQQVLDHPWMQHPAGAGWPQPLPKALSNMQHDAKRDLRCFVPKQSQKSLQERINDAIDASVHSRAGSLRGGGSVRGGGSMRGGGFVRGGGLTRENGSVRGNGRAPAGMAQAAAAQAELGKVVTVQVQ